MITYEDQSDLFKLISNILKRNIECYAFGGTAMMFQGYKDLTKDIDLLFETEADRTEFIRAITSLGFKETSPIKIYSLQKLRDKHAPVMYVRDESRFDLFVSQVFKTKISETMKKEVSAIHNYKTKSTLTIKVVGPETLILLKSVTDREKDFEDILTLIKMNKNLNWQQIIDEAIWQYNNGNGWALYDLEKTLRELKKYVFIENKYIKQLYAAAEE